MLTGEIQCAIAVFEGLFPPPHDRIIHELLFELATWHGLAKLRLHTELSTCALEVSTTRLGSDLRRFESVTCEAFDTRELPSEEAARGRRMAALAKKRGPSRGRVAKSSDAASTKPKKRKRKKRFNLSTYKLHALGDYAEAIRAYGTTDNYNTQLVSDAPCNLRISSKDDIPSTRGSWSTGAPKSSMSGYTRDSLCVASPSNSTENDYYITSKILLQVAPVCGHVNASMATLKLRSLT
jgi:hypothetical protein